MVIIFLHQLFFVTALHFLQCELQLKIEKKICFFFLISVTKFIGMHRECIVASKFVCLSEKLQYEWKYVVNKFTCQHLLRKNGCIQVYVHDLDSQCICETVSQLFCVCFFLLLFIFFIPFLLLFLSVFIAGTAATAAAVVVVYLISFISLCSVVLILFSAFDISFHNQHAFTCRSMGALYADEMAQMGQLKEIGI